MPENPDISLHAPSMICAAVNLKYSTYKRHEHLPVLCRDCTTQIKTIRFKHVKRAIPSALSTLVTAPVQLALTYTAIPVT